MFIAALALALVSITALVFAVTLSQPMWHWLAIVTAVAGLILLVIDWWNKRRIRRRETTDNEHK